MRAGRRGLKKLGSWESWSSNPNDRTYDTIIPSNQSIKNRKLSLPGVGSDKRTQTISHEQEEEGKMTPTLLLFL